MRARALRSNSSYVALSSSVFLRPRRDLTFDLKIRFIMSPVYPQKKAISTEFLDRQPELWSSMRRFGVRLAGVTTDGGHLSNLCDFIAQNCCQLKLQAVCGF